MLRAVACASLCALACGLLAPAALPARPALQSRPVVAAARHPQRPRPAPQMMVVASHHPLPRGPMALRPFAAPLAALSRCVRASVWQLAAALVLCAAALLVRPGTATAAPMAMAVAVSKGGGSTKTGEFVTSLAMGGGLCLWGWKVTRTEEEEEKNTIKEESENMKRMAKEFTEVSGQVSSDEDLFTALNKRKEEMGKAGPDAAGPSDGGSSAVLDKPPAEPTPEPPTAAEASGEPSAEDIERLKRMFGGSDEE